MAQYNSKVAGFSHVLMHVIDGHMLEKTREDRAEVDWYPKWYPDTQTHDALIVTMADGSQFKVTVEQLHTNSERGER